MIFSHKNNVNAFFPDDTGIDSEKLTIIPLPSVISVENYLMPWSDWTFHLNRFLPPLVFDGVWSRLISRPKRDRKPKSNDEFYYH